MSRNPELDYSKYVIELIDHEGGKRFAVGAKQPSGKYLLPLTDHEVKIYGLLYFLISPRALDDLPSYPTKKQALRRARYIFSGGRETLTEAISYKPQEVTNHGN